MMPETLEDFYDLAWRALETPAEASLQQAVAQALAAHPEWMQAWADLRDSHHELQTTVPVVSAMADADRTAKIPADRLNQLMREVDAAPMRRQRWPWLGAAMAAAIVVLFWVLPRGSDDFEFQPWSDRAPASLREAFSKPWSELVLTAQIPVLRDTPAVQLQSPLIATAPGPVTIAWRGDTASVTAVIRQNNREISRQTGSSPLVTPPLVADTVYELYLYEGAKLLTREHFMTTAETLPQATGLAGVMNAIIAEPMHLGDALLTWHALDQKTRQSDAGRRLGLWLALEARQPDLLDEVRTP